MRRLLFVFFTYLYTLSGVSNSNTLPLNSDVGNKEVGLPLFEFVHQSAALRTDKFTGESEEVKSDKNKSISQLQYDLAVTSIKAPSNVLCGSNFDVIVEVSNIGTSDVSGTALTGNYAFKVNLFCDGAIIDTKSRISLKSGATATFKFEMQMAADAENPLSIYAVVDFTKDETPDYSDLRSRTIYVYPLLNEYIEFDFEDGSSWATEYGNWTFVDLDQTPIGMDGIPGFTAGETKTSFFIFDYSDCGEEFDESYGAHSGYKCLAALFRNDNGTTDDWAISPELPGYSLTVSFWARSCNSQLPEKIEMLYSEGSLDPMDFILLKTLDLVPTEWTKCFFDVPDGAKFFAIRSCATGSYMLLLDDFSIILQERVSTPMTSYSKKKLTLEMPEWESKCTIKYTLNGGNPTEGIEYTGPIEFEKQDYVVKYIATHPQRIDSEIGEFVFHAGDYTVEAPIATANYEKREITLSHPHVGWPLTYTIKRDNGNNAYVNINSPKTVSITPGSSIMGYVTMLTVFADETDELFASDEVSVPIEFIQTPPTLEFDGYNLVADAENADNGITIRLTINGNKTEVAPGTTMHLEETGSVSCVAISDTRFASNSTNLTINAWFNGEKGEVLTPGTLAEGMKWCEGELAPEITLSGKLNAADFTTLRGFNGVRHLDISDVEIVNALPARAFAGTDMVSLTMPTATTTCENAAFGGASDLSSVTWQAPNAPSAEAFTERANPNMLLFVSSGNAPENAGDLKVVKERRIPNLELTDGYPFFTPMSFTAEAVSMTRDFSQKTVIEDVRGWESIALPFSPTSIRHYKNGECAPFSNDAAVASGAKPFWLYEMTDFNTFERADRIEAHKPYLISMPHNELYAERYDLGGAVTFSAGETGIEPLPEQTGVAAVSYMRDDLGDGAFTLNVGEPYDGHSYGSVFVQGLRALRPFEGYFTQNVRNSSRKIVLRDALSDVRNVGSDNADGLRISVNEGHVTILSDRDRKIVIAAMTGQVVRIVEAKAGVEVDGGTLAPGIYLIANQKFVVR